MNPETPTKDFVSKIVNAPVLEVHVSVKGDEDFVGPEGKLVFNVTKTKRSKAIRLSLNDRESYVYGTPAEVAAQLRVAADALAAKFPA